MSRVILEYRGENGGVTRIERDIGVPGYSWRPPTREMIEAGINRATDDLLRGVLPPMVDEDAKASRTKS